MTVLFIILAVIAVTVLLYYFGAFYPKFSKHDKQKEFEIPGLEENFVPQGLDYVQTHNIFLLSGYMSDASPSRVYCINGDGEVVKYFTLSKNNEDYVGHAGGVASDGTYIWVVGDSRVETLLFADVMAVENGGKVNINSTFEPGNGCDFVDVYNNQLVIGEFYHAKKYPTSETHHVKVSEKETTHAIALCYPIDGTKAGGVAENPTSAFTLPDLAQGIAFSGEKVIISTSFSIPDSKICIYKNSLLEQSSKTITINNRELPLYEFNSNNLLDTITAPTMTEEITIVGGRTYILFESACNKYKMINRTRIKNVISLDL